MFKCKKCGSDLEPNAKFCTNCGDPVSNVTKNSTVSSESINNNESKKWNPIYMFIFPILWGLWKYQYADAEKIELKISEVVGASFLIIFIPIIITTLILIVKKLRKEQYINFIKHTTIGTFIMFLLAIGVEVNTSLEQKNKSIEESIKQGKFKAAELYKKDCDGGDAEGCHNLGLMYSKGEGVKQDKLKAAELFKKACDGGNPGGCFNLGVMHGKGEKVKQDKVKAVELYKKACDGGDAKGCNNLGLVYDNGEGVKQNKFKAVELYRKACDGQDTRGCFNLGIMYSIGEGVRQDKKNAKELFGKACDGQLEDGCKKYKILNEQKY